MKTLNITEDAFIKLTRIREARPQDKSRAATFDHILYIYEEQKFREKAMKL
jgi:hypothetical protein